jgi:hypothetical protein
MKCRSLEFINMNPSKEGQAPEERTGFPDFLIDYLTGQKIPFSNRDNIRQKLIKFLVEKKGYDKQDLTLDREIRFELEGRQISSLVDVTITIENRTLIVVKCAAGSVVSRERQVIATARLLEDYIIPLAVVTNGVDTELLDADSEKVIAEGTGSIPTRAELSEKSKDLDVKPVNRKKLEYEKNILYTYDQMSCTLYCKSEPHPE